MNGLNKAFLIGNLGRDPELRATATGLPVVKLALATRHAKKVNDQWVDTPDWHRVTGFGKEAEYLSRVAHKGDGLAVECAIRPRKWTDKEGKTHYEVDLIVERVLWVSSPRRAVMPLAVDEAPPVREESEGSVEEVPF
jgi:single-strand DNA-binding protein